MHVKYEANWKYVLTIPAAFMSIFLILALVPDIGLRGHWVSEERQAFMAEPRVKASHAPPTARSARPRATRRTISLSSVV